MNNTLSLVIDGNIYRGWTSISVRRSLDEGVNEFELGILDRWAGRGLGRVRNGAPCQVLIGDELVVTGYIDRIKRRYDGEQREVRVSGRSKAQDLGDCSYPVDKLPASWKDQSVLKICQLLADPFNVKVSDSSGLADQKIPVVQVHPGDTPFDLIAAYMRNIGARIISRPDGNLEIVSPGRDRLATALRLGENILSAEDESSLRDRFSSYHVVSQTRGDNDNYSMAAASVTGSANDPVMEQLRFRPTTINAETAIDSSAVAKRRAEVARNQAAGHSHTTTYTVHGWRHSSGLWAPNHQVHVVDEECGWDDWLMIGTVEIALDDQGPHTNLTVVRPEAYDITAIPSAKTDGIL